MILSRDQFLIAFGAIDGPMSVGASVNLQFPLGYNKKAVLKTAGGVSLSVTLYHGSMEIEIERYGSLRAFFDAYNRKSEI